MTQWIDADTLARSKAYAKHTATELLEPVHATHMQLLADYTRLKDTAVAAGKAKEAVMIGREMRRLVLDMAVLAGRRGSFDRVQVATGFTAGDDLLDLAQMAKDLVRGFFAPDTDTTDTTEAMKDLADMLAAGSDPDDDPPPAPSHVLVTA